MPRKPAAKLGKADRRARLQAQALRRRATNAEVIRLDQVRADQHRMRHTRAAGRTNLIGLRGDEDLLAEARDLGIDLNPRDYLPDVTA